MGRVRTHRNDFFLFLFSLFLGLPQLILASKEATIVFFNFFVIFFEFSPTGRVGTHRNDFFLFLFSLFLGLSQLILAGEVAKMVVFSFFFLIFFAFFWNFLLRVG